MIERVAEPVVELDTAQPMRRGLAPVTIGLVTEQDAAGAVVVETSNPPAIAADGQLTATGLTTLACYIGDAITLRTTVAPWATSYEWEVRHEQNRTTERFTTALPAALWTPRKAGHYVPRVRPVNGASVGAWLSLRDTGAWLFAWLAPPKF